MLSRPIKHTLFLAAAESTKVPVPTVPYAVRAEFSYIALDPRAESVIAVEILSSFIAQNIYPAAGTGTVIVQVVVQTQNPPVPVNVQVDPGVGNGTAGICAAGSPVAFVSTRAEGVPSAGVVSTALVIAVPLVRVPGRSPAAIARYVGSAELPAENRG